MYNIVVQGFTGVLLAWTRAPEACARHGVERKYHENELRCNLISLAKVMPDRLKVTSASNKSNFFLVPGSASRDRSVRFSALVAEPSDQVVLFFRRLISPRPEPPGHHPADALSALPPVNAAVVGGGPSLVGAVDVNGC